MPVRSNSSAERELDHITQTPEALEHLMAVAREYVALVKPRLPRDTGRSAESVHAELIRDPVRGVHPAVGPDKGTTIMLSEFGTEKQQPRPVFRTTAEEFERR